MLFFFSAISPRTNVAAQHPLYQEVFHYTSDNGMPQNSISGMVADNKGYIWIGTGKGLVRFDGHKLRVFRLSDIVEDCSNIIYNVAWINGMLVAEEYFKSYTFIIKDENTIIPYNPGGWGDSLWKNQVTKNYYLYRNHWLDSIAGTYVAPHKVIALDSSGFTGYYLTDAGDIIYFDRGRKQPLGINSRSAWHVFLSNTTIYALENNTRLRSSNSGNAAISVKGTLPGLLKTLSRREIADCYFIQSDKTKFLRFRNKLFLLTESSPGVVDAALLTNTAYMENPETVIFQPENNLLLIGTARDGFYLYKKKFFKTLLYPQQGIQVKGESRNRIFSIQSLNDSLLLSDKGTLSLSGNARLFPGQIEFSFALPKTAAGYLINREKERPGLIVRDSAMHELTSLETGSAHTVITSFCNDGDTTYLAEDGGRILKLLLQAGSPFRKLEEIKIPDLTEIICMLKMPGDSLWLGTRKTGLYSMNLNTKKIRWIKELSDFAITNMYADRTGTVWISVYGIGLFRYRQRDGIIRMPLDRNKNLLFPYAIAEDKTGFMWISTGNGLFRFLKADLDTVNGPDNSIYYNYFTREYGFLTNEFNGGCNPALAILKDGRFVFPSIKGMMIFDPQKVPLEMPDTIISISDIMLDNVRIAASDNLELDPAFNNLAMKISTFFFGHPYNLQLEYRLSGGASGWIPVDLDGQISFNRLGYGEYTLTIRMLRGYGYRDYTYKVMHFSVRPFWYQTRWFYGLLIFLVMVLVGIFLHRRNKKILRQKELLETEVDQRTEELKQSEEKVKQNTRFRSQVTSLVLHDVRSPLFYLNKITGSIYKTSSGKVPEIFRDQLKELHLSVKEVSEYAQNLFAWINAQQDDFVMSSTPVKLLHLFEDLSANYHLLAAENQNTIAHNVDCSLTVITQADLLQIVLRNLVDNAIKYTQGGRIMLSAVKKIRGKLEIKSEEGGGTAVTILLPVNTEKAGIAGVIKIMQ